MCVCVVATYKVRSLGMWLKLETGMLLMLLLFSVLLGNKSKENGDDDGGIVRRKTVRLIEILHKSNQTTDD